MNIKKNQQFDLRNDNVVFLWHLKQCNKLIVLNFFLSLGLFFLLFKIIEILSAPQYVPFQLTSLVEDSHLKIIGGMIFSIFLLLFSFAFIFRMRDRALKTLSKEKLDFFVWNFYFALIPIFGSIYLFVWTYVMRKKYSIKTKYSPYQSLFSLLVINMLIIVAYWMIYMIKGGISYINFGNILSQQPFHFTIPTIFDLFILPVKAIVGWTSFFYIKPAFAKSLYVMSEENDGAIFCILLLLLVICYSLVASTSTFDVIINRLILRTKGETKRIIVIPMIIICLLSHFLGIYHEIIIFYPIYGKFLLLIGFDLLTVFYVLFFSITIGYGTSLFNPLVVNFLKIETNPWLKMGAHIQFLLLVILLSITIFFVLNYAQKTLNNLTQSVVYDTTIATKNSSDFLQENLVLTPRKINNFYSFIFVIFLLLLTNHNWFYYFTTSLSWFDSFISFFKNFFFWIVPPNHFVPNGAEYELDDMPLIASQRHIYRYANYWIIVCYCFFFIIFNYKEIDWSDFAQNFKKFIPFIVAIILCKAIEINFLEHGLFALIHMKCHNFIVGEPFALKTTIFIFLIFISLLMMVNPVLGSGDILLKIVNYALITKGIGYATYFHAFLLAIIIVNLLSPTSLLLPFLIQHKISYFTYIKSSWKIILSLILVIFAFVCCHNYLLK